jgi:hypothetical protein
MTAHVVVGGGLVEDARDVLADQVSQSIPDGFKRRACEQANPPTIPLRRRHPVEAHILRVGEAIDAELLDLPQLHDLIPLAVSQQKGPVILLPLALRMWCAHHPSSIVAGRYTQASQLK